jgi:hypothetical protein
MAIRRIRRQGCEWNCREAKQKRQAKAAQKTHATHATSILSLAAHTLVSVVKRFIGSQI